VLTNVLGGRPEVDIHLHERELEGGEVMLLCSDGVHGVLSADDLKNLLQSTPDPEAAADAIVRQAIEAGSRDNLTALVVSYETDK
nr:SpoIIE family protein phosphatase [Acidobacteriota bacterium]